MKITCQSCGSKYTVSDEKVQGKTVKIKCRKCSATIMVNSSGAVQQNGAMAEPVSFGSGGAEGGGPYTVNVGEGDQRTMSLPEIIDAYNASVITAETYVWADGMADWQPLGQVDSIVGALHAAANSQPPAAEPEPVHSPAPMPAVAMPAMPTPATSLGNQIPSEPYAAAAAPRAARREPRAARDLFGGGGFGQETQPVADDIATSSPLFQAGAMPAAGPQPGQRDENSVLFSLSALTAKAGAAPISSPGGSASKTTATKEDSGLIDLRALSAGASAPAPSNLVPDNAALFPLGMPAPAAAHSGGAVLGIPDAPPPKSRTGLFVAIGGVVALAAMAGAFLAMKGGEDRPAPTPEQTAAAPVPTPAPTPEPAPTPSAEASAAPTASATAAVAAGGPPKGGFRPGGFVKPGVGKEPPPSKPGAPAPAAKPGGNCNCPPGDLMCAMKCSTKK